MENGERWAYRHHERAELAEAVVAAIGTKRPLRTKVRFVDDVFEGRTEWIPPSRLKCLWGERESFELRESAWRVLHAHGNEASSTEIEASQWIFDVGLKKVVGLTTGRRRGLGTVAIVYDWAEMQTLTGLTRDDFPSRLALGEKGEDFLPWPAARTIAQAYLNPHAPDIIRDLRGYVQRAMRDRNLDRAWSQQWKEPERTYLSEFVAGYQNLLAKVADWAGEPRMAEVDEILELRAALQSQGAIIREHTMLLIRGSQTELAWSLWKALKPEAPKRSWTVVIRLEQSLLHEAVMDGRALTTSEMERLRAAHVDLIERAFGELDPA
jgi:hypothetical protein